MNTPNTRNKPTKATKAIPALATAAPTPTGDWIDNIVEKLPDLLTLPEAAKTLRVSRRTLARYASSGRITVIYHSPARCVIPRAEVARYLRSLTA